MASNIVFQQVSNNDGSTEFRLNFGRKKALVYRRHDGFYYLDIYNNKEGRKRFNGICFGLDELDFLISIRSNLDSLQACFPSMESATENQAKWEPARASSSHQKPQQEATNVVSSYQAVPYQSSSNHQDHRIQFKRPTPVGENNVRPVKFQRIENISPEPKPIDDNYNHQELFNDFFE